MTDYLQNLIELKQKREISPFFDFEFDINCFTNEVKEKRFILKKRNVPQSMRDYCVRKIVENIKVVVNRMRYTKNTE